jgi:magnesium-protoporphyrin O-methyltransferase
MFSPRAARRTLKRYRTRGLDTLERELLEQVSSRGLEGARVLEIGGGIGAIQAELLEAGAETGEVVELVAAYEPYARELARDKGIESRTSFRVEDVLEEPAGVEPADVVVLNRVVCCSSDGIELAGIAAGLCTRTLALSFPRERMVVKAGLHALNAVMGLLRRSFRVFVHPRAALVAAAEAEGLALDGSGGTFAWEFAVFRRPTAS